jgi:hypothetical protein
MSAVIVNGTASGSRDKRTSGVPPGRQTDQTHNSQRTSKPSPRLQFRNEGCKYANMAPAGIAPWQRWDFDLETTEHFLRRMTPIGACLSGVDDDVRNDRRNCCSALRTVIAGTQPVHPKGPSTGVTRLDRFPRNPDARGHTADAPPHSLTGLSPASANDALTAGLVRWVQPPHSAPSRAGGLVASRSVASQTMVDRTYG